MKDETRLDQINRAALSEYPYYGELDPRIGFRLGAMWADRNPRIQHRTIWRKPWKQQPQGDSDILCLNYDGDIWKIGGNHVADNYGNDWSLYYRYKYVKRWAYVSEVLAIPKKETPGWLDARKQQPKVDEEVIVLLSTDAPGYYKISFGHIVDKMCKDYNGWNIPGVRFWMPCPTLPTEKNCQK